MLEALAAGTAFPALGAAAAAPTAAAPAPATIERASPSSPYLEHLDPATIPTSGAPFEDVPGDDDAQGHRQALDGVAAFVPHALSSIEAGRLAWPS